MRRRLVCGAEIIHIVKSTLSRKWPPDFRRPFSYHAEEGKEKSETFSVTSMGTRKCFTFSITVTTNLQLIPDILWIHSPPGPRRRSWPRCRRNLRYSRPQRQAPAVLTWKRWWTAQSGRSAYRLFYTASQERQIPSPPLCWSPPG